MNEEKEMSYGQVNYQAYYDDRKGVTFDGRPIPKWEDLGDDIRHAWAVGASAVIEALFKSMKSQWDT